MIPLESLVPEIGTPGSESRGWKRDDGSGLGPARPDFANSPCVSAIFVSD